MSKKKEKEKETPFEPSTSLVPGSRLSWMKAELDRVGEPYELERHGKEYQVRPSGERSSARTQEILGYQAKGRQPPKKVGGLRGYFRYWVYTKPEIIMLLSLGLILLLFVKFFGLGGWESTLGPMWKSFGLDSWGYPIRAAGLLFGVIALLWVLEKAVGKPTKEEMGPGVTIVRWMGGVLWIFIIGFLVAGWLGVL